MICLADLTLADFMRLPDNVRVPLAQALGLRYVPGPSGRPRLRLMTPSERRARLRAASN